MVAYGDDSFRLHVAWLETWRNFSNPVIHLADIANS